jgi:hypothetical protein
VTVWLGVSRNCPDAGFELPIENVIPAQGVELASPTELKMSKTPGSVFGGRQSGDSLDAHAGVTKRSRTRMLSVSFGTSDRLRMVTVASNVVPTAAVEGQTAVA